LTTGAIDLAARYAKITAKIVPGNKRKKYAIILAYYRYAPEKRGTKKFTYPESNLKKLNNYRIMKWFT
jgi:hypothetical protein